jgi:hypothetical protein
MAAGFAMAIAEIERTISPKFGPLVEHLLKQAQAHVKGGQPMPRKPPTEYHVIELYSGISHGGFADLLAQDPGGRSALRCRRLVDRLRPRARRARAQDGAGVRQSLAGRDRDAHQEPSRGAALLPGHRDGAAAPDRAGGLSRPADGVADLHASQRGARRQADQRPAAQRSLAHHHLADRAARQAHDHRERLGVHRLGPGRSIAPASRSRRARANTSAPGSRPSAGSATSRNGASSTPPTMATPPRGSASS